MFKKKYFTVLFVIFIAVLIFSVRLVVLKNNDIPKSPAFMYGENMYLITAEKLTNYKDSDLIKVGEVNDSIDKFSLKDSGQGYYVPEKSSIYEYKTDDIEYDDVLIIKFSENIHFTNAYNKNNYYISRKIIDDAVSK